jgi:hypothetical protein
MAAETWDCPTCGQPRHTRYCGECGERALHRHDLTLVGLGEEAIEAVAHVDGRVFRTARALLLQPGDLTLAYVRGQRKPFLGPLQTFLIANVIFFAFLSAIHSNVFANTLDSHMQRQYYKGLATRLVTARVASLGTTVAAFAEAFDHAVKVNAKSLIVLMTPPFAAGSALLFWRRRRPFVTHVTFALHFYAFFLLEFCIAGPAISLALAAVRLLGVRFPATVVDGIMLWSLIAWAASYVAVAAGRVYEVRGVWRLAGAAALALVAGLTIVGYRFVVFLITLYTTSA